MKNQKPVTLSEISKLILENNVVLVNMMDEKIKDNNEYIFEHFNNQTDRILNLFKGVMRVNQDGNLGIYV